jgi:Fe-S-cluster containining protein
VDNLEICSKCRRCCIGTEIRLADTDIPRWEKEGRLDILLAINPRMGGSRHLIRKPDSEECIFLKADGSCSIQSTKPKICIRFPETQVQADAMGCKLQIIPAG